MNSLRERAMKVLNRGVQAAFGTTIRVIRGASVVEGVEAVPSNLNIEQLDEGEVTVIGKAQTWSLEPDQLRFDMEVVEPEAGFVIEQDCNGYTLVYEVVAENGERVWEPVGSDDTESRRIRIFAKLIEKRVW